MEEDLELLSRAELQQRAKQVGIKANQKSSDIIAEIRRRTLPPCTPKTPGITRKQLVNDAEPNCLDLKMSALDLGSVPRLSRAELSWRSPANAHASSTISRERSPGHRAEQDSHNSGVQDNPGARVVSLENPASDFVTGDSCQTRTDADMKRRVVSENAQRNSLEGIYNLKEAMRLERERRRSMRTMNVAADKWERVESRSKPGQYYYWNALRQQASWETPLEVSRTDL